MESVFVTIHLIVIFILVARLVLNGLSWIDVITMGERLRKVHIFPLKVLLQGLLRVVLVGLVDKVVFSQLDSHEVRVESWVILVVVCIRVA